MHCDPVFTKELNNISAAIEFEDELANASEQMEICDLFDKSPSHGEGYSAGYQDGFWKGRELLIKYEDARRESIRQKHDELMGRCGLHDL